MQIHTFLGQDPFSILLGLHARAPPCLIPLAQSWTLSWQPHKSHRSHFGATSQGLSPYGVGARAMTSLDGPACMTRRGLSLLHLPLKSLCSPRVGLGKANKVLSYAPALCPLPLSQEKLWWRESSPSTSSFDRRPAPPTPASTCSIQQSCLGFQSSPKGASGTKPENRQSHLADTEKHTSAWAAGDDSQLKNKNKSL